MAPATEILTVGHSNHEERDFIELLRRAGVELLVDDHWDKGTHATVSLAMGPSGD